MIGQLSDVSKLLLGATRKLTPRKACLYKFAASCEVLRLDVGYPFYNIDRHTFIEFLDEATNTLFSMLSVQF